MNSASPKAQPTHRIYSVTQKDEAKPFWFEIGAVWPHKDSKGFNLEFNAMPVCGAKVVVREISTAAEEAREF